MKCCRLFFLIIIILYFNNVLLYGQNKQDTLNVSYTYWWGHGGPFAGLCGDKYSLVFTGAVTKLHTPFEPKDIASGTLQKGVVKINNIKVAQAAKEENYNNEKYFTSNCFYNAGLKEGDKGMVFIYEYEDRYAIPSNSILKIISYDDPSVKSIEKYIKNNQNPIAIKDDFEIWKKYGLDDDLKETIECFENN